MRDSFLLLERNAERLRCLVDDLLESRSLDAGHFSLNIKPVNLTQIVAESILHLHDYVSQLKVTIEQTGINIPIWVDADAVRLQQIVFNLISNATKYSPESGVVEVNIIVSANGMARVSVRDRGQGIPAEFQKKIFQKFARGPAPNNRKVASTGLGLCIVKSLVEAHGGVMGFSSVEGQGSTFFFELPQVQANTDQV
jgi:signal transduction histidine kinase